MSHVRAQVRVAVVDALKAAAISGVGSKVHSGRIHPFGEKQLPAIAVYCRSENIAVRSTRPNGDEGYRRRRMISVVVEAYAVVDSDLDDALDALALAIEQALVPARTLGGLAKNFEPVGTEIGVVEEAQRNTGVIRLNFQAEVHTADSNLDQPAA